MRAERDRPEAPGPPRSIQGVLLDIDGVLVVSWEPIPGAVDTLAWLRGQGIPFRLITNTTSHSRAALAETLREAAFDVRDDEVITAPVATAAYLRANHAGKTCYLLGDDSVRQDFDGVEFVEDHAEVVVVGGADPAFTWENLNRCFRMLLEGAAFVAMHRNMMWMTEEGLKLDAGAFVAGLEEATGTRATVAGKPARAFFEQAVDALGIPPQRAAMVGDDVENDVLAAQEVGLAGVLVRTGKFRWDVMERIAGDPDHVLDSIADLPDLLRGT